MSIKSKSPKLTVELIPSTCHYSNVRTTVKPKEWDKIRFLSYETAKHKCQICKETGKEQGFKHDVECHEIWDYDDVNHIQKLVGLVALCVKCHRVKHIGRAMAMGNEKESLQHLAKVNNWTPEQITEHIDTSFITYKERSQYEWLLDLSLLNEEPYNLKINIEKKRIFEIKKYKKRRTKTKSKKKVSKRPPRKK